MLREELFISAMAKNCITKNAGRPQMCSPMTKIIFGLKGTVPIQSQEILLHTSSVIAKQSISQQAAAIASSSSLLKTFPVGLCGLYQF